ncbi:O-Glycosyl hydrolases family 17 protein [Artemisia annua]|uniref:O-Glycosyl hydrolases family 17 protein n=1 Tax=Artemisia annua TaxID=35608 RepID=A0A2U1MAG4_ARTAN|nr:O-Glycosyl hydrolases family 17 protein [Artemisia annua]
MWKSLSRKTGWPSSGDPENKHANPANAAAYNRDVIKKATECTHCRSFWNSEMSIMMGISTSAFKGHIFLIPESLRLTPSLMERRMGSMYCIESKPKHDTRFLAANLKHHIGLLKEYFRRLKMATEIAELKDEANIAPTDIIRELDINGDDLGFSKRL